MKCAKFIALNKALYGMAFFAHFMHLCIDYSLCIAMLEKLETT